MSFRNLTSESPSFPKAKVPRYPMTMVPAAPVNPVRSEAQGLLAHSGVKAFMKIRESKRSDENYDIFTLTCR